MLNYGCGNGTCGMCKVRVISGEVVKTQPFDYPLSEAEKRQGYTLACAHTAASSELTLELLEAAGPLDIPQQQIVSTVRAITDLAPDTRLLHLQTPRTPWPAAPAMTATCSSSSRATTPTPLRSASSAAL
jgi:CDP-4-dehydro-6-deoxyglucose reductase